ncbi:type II toxin-antitoxin system HicA family toxin [Desulfosporosinus youngiae]
MIQRKRRDLVKKLESNGFSKIRDHGDHTIYKAPNMRAVQVQVIEKSTK